MNAATGSLRNQLRNMIDEVGIDMMRIRSGVAVLRGGSLAPLFALRFELEP
jgi:hypothetical protein